MRVFVVGVVVALGGAAGAAPRDPASIVIVVDRSAAMSGERIDLVRAAVRDVVEAPDGDRVAVVGFAKRATVIVPMGAHDAKRSIEPAIAKLDADPSFDEELGAGLDLAGTLLDIHKPIRHVVLITNTEATILTAHSVDKLRAKSISISTVAIQAENHAALDELAVRTRGTAIAVDDLVDLRRALGEAVEPPPARLPKAAAMTTVFVIDRSYSMNGPNLDIAKAAILGLIDRFRTDDYVGVVAFDCDAMTISRLVRVTHRARLATDLSRLRAGGGTNIFSGLKLAAELLQDASTPTKRVVLITDGGAPNDGLVELCNDMAQHHITIDVIGVQAADRTLLAPIAQITDGRLFMVDGLGTRLPL